MTERSEADADDGDEGAPHGIERSETLPGVSQSGPGRSGDVRQRVTQLECPVCQRGSKGEGVWMKGQGCLKMKQEIGFWRKENDPLPC